MKQNHWYKHLRLEEEKSTTSPIWASQQIWTTTKSGKGINKAIHNSNVEIIRCVRDLRTEYWENEREGPSKQLYGMHTIYQEEPAAITVNQRQFRFAAAVYTDGEDRIVVNMVDDQLKAFNN